MASVEELLTEMGSNPAGVRFADACKVARHFFGEARIKGSHHIWKMNWPGDPRVNLQKGSGPLAKAYQVDQLLAAVAAEKRRLEGIATTVVSAAQSKPHATKSTTKIKTKRAVKKEKWT